MSQRGLFRLLVPAVAAVISLGVPVVASAEGFPGVEHPLTNRFTAYAPNLAISGTKVVYDDNRSGNYDIYLYDLATFTEKRLTTNSAGQHTPAISGTNVVYQDQRNGNWDIYLYDLATDTEKRLTTNSARQSRPVISGTKVVYEDDRNGNLDIYLYDLATDTEKRLTTNSATQSYPDISGTNVVYQDQRNGNWDIYLYDLVTNAERRLTTNSSNQSEAAISGTKVVYADYRNSNYDIYVYDLVTNAEKLLDLMDGLEDQWHPMISGDKVVYQDQRGGDVEIYLYDLVADAEARLSMDAVDQVFPVVSGDLVLYSVPLDDFGQYGIYLGELAAPRISVSAPSVVGYGGKATLKGTLASFTGIPIAGQSVALKVSTDGVLWTQAGATSTSSSGAFSLTSPALYRANYLRVIFRGIDPQYPPAHSSSRLVKPKASVGRPVTPATMRRTSTYTIRGTLKPKHPSGSAAGKLYCYRYERGKYRLKKTYAVTASDYSTYSRYQAKVRLPYSGKWKLRMRHNDTDHAATYSSWRSTTVR
jgi:TolB protein